MADPGNDFEFAVNRSRAASSKRTYPQEVSRNHEVIPKNNYDPSRYESVQRASYRPSPAPSRPTTNDHTNQERSRYQPLNAISESGVDDLGEFGYAKQRSNPEMRGAGIARIPAPRSSSARPWGTQSDFNYRNNNPSEGYRGKRIVHMQQHRNFSVAEASPYDTEGNSNPAPPRMMKKAVAHRLDRVGAPFGTNVDRLAPPPSTRVERAPFATLRMDHPVQQIKRGKKLYEHASPNGSNIITNPPQFDTRPRRVYEERNNGQLQGNVNNIRPDIKVHKRGKKIIDRRGPGFQLGYYNE